MQLDQSKLARQNEGAYTWKRAGGKGTLVYPPRFGKTKTALIIIDKVRIRVPDSEIIVLVPSQVIQDQWQALIDELKLENIQVYTIDTFMKLTINNSYSPHLLIVDEIHKFVSERRYGIFKLVHFKFILGLTGTFPVGRDVSLLNAVCPVVDTITEKEAISKGWISKFIEYNYALQLPDADKERYKEYSVPIAEILELFDRSHTYFDEGLFKDSYDVIQSCYSGKKTRKGYIKPLIIRAELAARKGWHNELDLSNGYNRNIEEHWNPEVIKELATLFNDQVRKRNDILIHHHAKLAIVLQLFKAFPITTICFNESTIFADEIAYSINEVSNREIGKTIAAAYHSNIKSQPMLDASGEFIVYKSGIKKGQAKLFGKDTVRNVIIESVKQEEILFLSTAKAFDEGLDIPNIEQVITTAGTANPIQYAQRNARGKTVDVYNPDKVTRIINIYFDDFYLDGKKVYSRDASKLYYRQKKSNTIAIKVTDITEIK